MSYPISVQLYSLRDQAKDGNHVAVIKKIADIGYTGVETATLYGLKPREYVKLISDHGLKISGHHSFCNIPTKEELNKFIDEQKELGTPYCINAWIAPENYATVDSIKKVADQIEPIRAELEKAGLIFCIHNHDFEFVRLDGKVKLEILAQLVPKLQFQVDSYWAANFGAEVPAKMIAQFKDRTPLLHVKDGSFVKGEPMLAAGKGKQDFPAIFKAANPNVLKWAIVELDACATDMMKAVEDSYNYLVGAGLATGNKAVKR